MEAGNHEMDFLKRILNKYFTPHTAVFSSDRVKKMFEKYGLTPGEFLRPFGRYNGTINYNPFPTNHNYMPGRCIGCGLERCGLRFLDF